jgi:hypothetical protein
MNANNLCSAGINPGTTDYEGLTAVNAMDDSNLLHVPLEVVVTDDGLRFVVEIEMVEPVHGTVFKTHAFSVEDLEDAMREAAMTNSEDIFLGFQDESLIDEIKEITAPACSEGPSL